MLAHKVDGEPWASYSNMLLATQMLERWAEARDLLPPKVAATTGLATTCYQMPGNLFPTHKLKSNCTFATWAATVGNDTTEEDPSVEPEGEEETKPSPDEEVEIPGKVTEAEQTI